MRASVFEQFGEPATVLQVQETPIPEPRKGEVLVRMLASPVNPSDLMVVRGVYGVLPELPATPGFEGVGVVEAANAGLRGRFFTGKRVAVLNREGGNWSEWITVPANQVIPLARDLSLEQCAMFFVNPATAYIMVRHVLQVPQAAWLLQTAAGSALGRMVIRLGRSFGFRTLNVVRREEQVDELKALGADEVVVFNPETDEVQRFREKVMAITREKGVPFAVDPVGGATGSAVVECLAHGGRMLVFGTLSDQPLSFSPRLLMGAAASVEGFWLANWMLRQTLIGKLRLVRSITRLMRQGILISDVGKAFSLDEITEAVREAERPGRGGKTLLRISESP